MHIQPDFSDRWRHVCLPGVRRPYLFLLRVHVLSGPEAIRRGTGVSDGRYHAAQPAGDQRRGRRRPEEGTHRLHAHIHPDPSGPPQVRTSVNTDCIYTRYYLYLYSSYRYSSHSVVRLSKQGDAAYDTLRQLFEADDYKGLNAHISNDNIKRELQADGNFGLAKLVVDALLRKRVQSLVPVFSRMRLTDILRMKFSDTDWTVADLEYFIVRLSTFGEISVRIDQSDGTVSFLSSDFVDANQPAVSGGHDVVSLLQERMATSMKLSERVRMLEYEMNKNPTLLARKVVALKQGNGGPDEIAQNPMLADDLIDMVLDNDDSEAM